MPESVIECNGLVKAFKGVPAVDGLTFSVEPGEVFALIGPNGSGKTTTIRVLLGIYEADEGTVSVLGGDPYRQFERIGPQLGVMLEHPGLFVLLTGNEYLNLFAALFGLSPEEAAERKAYALSVVGLTEEANKRLHHYSKGMRQRMSLARCLMNRPRLMILDEPFDGIDAESRRDLVQILPELARETGSSVFITSHNLSEVEQIATRVAIVDHGQLVRLDSIETLCAPAPGRDVLVVHFDEECAPPEAEIRVLFPTARYDEHRGRVALDLATTRLSRLDVLRTLLDRGYSIDSFQRERKTLEAVYFSATGKARVR